MKKKVKLPISAYLLYLFLATFLLTGVSFSKYISSSSGKDEARVAKFGTLILTETTPTENKAKIIPGVNIKKDPKISYSDSEMATYIFVTVDAKDWMFDYNADTKEKIYEIKRDDETILMSWTMKNEWIYHSTEDNKQVFYLPVAANTTVDQTIITSNEIIVTEDITASEINQYQTNAMKIIFQAYAVQIHGFNSVNEAWTSVHSK